MMCKDRFGQVALFLILIMVSLTTVQCAGPKAVIIPREYPPKIQISDIASISVADEECSGDETFKSMLKGKLKQKISGSDCFKLDPDGEDAWIWFDIHDFYLREEITKSDGATMKMAFALVEFSIRWAGGKKVFSIQKDSMRSLQTRDATILDALAESVIKEFAKQVVPTQKRELRYFATGGSKGNAQGVTFAMAENWELAMKAWEEAVTLDPQDHKATYNIGVGYEQRNDIEMAYDFYTKATMMKPDETLYSEAAARAKKEIEDRAKIKRQRDEIKKLDELR